MKLTAKVKLVPTDEQFEFLKQTLEIANSACNFVSDKAWETKTFRQFSLQKIVYFTLRTDFSLTAQMVIRCISKVSDAYKKDKKTKRTFAPLGAIAYDNRILSWKISKSEVSIWTTSGRTKIPFVCGEHQKELLNGQRGESDLCYIDNEFYLFATCEVETPSDKDVKEFLGVDLGIVNLAVDSDGEVFSGKAVEASRKKYLKRRSGLQSKGTKSTKRKLKKLSGKQARFQKDTNHVISRRIVQKAQDTDRGIALENLKGIRSRATVRHSQRAQHANWGFYQLKQFISYKSVRLGIPVIYVDPRNTSRTCQKCGCVDKRNRTTQSIFSCVSCGFSAPADTNAAVNISAKATINKPMVSTSTCFM